MIDVKINLLSHGVSVPTYATPGSAGADLYAANAGAVELAPGARTLVPCGFSIALPE